MNNDRKELKMNANKFEFELNGDVAFMDYKLLHEKLFLILTEVPSGFTLRKGVAPAIVERVLQYAKDNHFKIIPLCPFVRGFLFKYPEWNELLSPDTRQFIRY